MEQEQSSPKKKSKTIFIVLALAGLAVLGGGALAFFSSNKDGAPTSQSSSQNNSQSQNQTNQNNAQSQSADSVPEVSYTNSCFSPSTLTVKQGQTVSFINNSSRSMQPASNDHPSHTDYPEFDSGSPVEKGETYEFTFTKKGTWGYHDHLRESCSGTVIVE